jgi:uncharacterized RDD family membrane protein YckC
VFKLQAAGLGDRLYLFLVQRDSSASPPKETGWMKTVEDGRVQGDVEIKPFHSLAAFAGKLWFFSPGMYRVFDGKEWQRFDAPWVGADPVATATPEQIWILSRIGTDFSLTSYAHDHWDRPMPVPVDPKDKDLFCAERCPSGLVVFKEKIYYTWLKDDRLHQFIFDGGRPGRVESLGESFGRLRGFEILAEPDRILVWYLPSPVSAQAGAAPSRFPIGLKIFDGNGWRDEPGLERTAPVGLLEIAPLMLQGKMHLLINTGIRIEDQLWEPGRPGRSVFLLGGDLGRSVLRYQGWVVFLLLVTISLGAAVLSFVLNRWKASSGDPDVSYASVWRRFVAKAIDTALVVVPVGFVVWFRLDPESLLFPNSLTHLISAGGRGVMIAPLLLFTYHALAEGLWGQTLGKRLCGIIVMDQTLKSCTMLQSVIRNLLRLIDGIGLYWVGIVSIAATDRWQRLGDWAGRTVVVRTKT